MATPADGALVELKPNDKVGGRFVVKKKLGEGACGQVFLVTEQDKQGRPFRTAAMKIEPRMKHADDEILKMEIFILKRMSKSKHCCKLLAQGNTSQFNWVVMSLLGQELADLKKKCPAKKFGHLTALRISIQAFTGLEELHRVGFIHRDIKPANLAMGHGSDDKVLFIFDFGLARQYLMPDPKGRPILRPERPRVMFRGTVRYCSLNVHQFKEQGRHDDLIAYMHSIIECVTTLPWRGQVRKEAAKIKEKTTTEELCKGCPSAFIAIMDHLKSLKYNVMPKYKTMTNAMAKDAKEMSHGANLTSMPYEWTGKKSKDLVPLKSAESQKGGSQKGSKKMSQRTGDATDRQEKKSAKEKAEKDKGLPDDQKTIQDFDETVVTEDGGESQHGADEGEFPANDDTLNGM